MNPTIKFNNTNKRSWFENDNNQETLTEKKQKIETTNSKLAQIFQNLEEIENLSTHLTHTNSDTKKIEDPKELLQKIWTIAKDAKLITQQIIEEENQKSFSFHDLKDAIQNPDLKNIPLILSSFFKEPKELAKLLNSLTNEDTYCFYTLLKYAFEQKNPVIFRQILHHISSHHSRFLSYNLFQNILVEVFNREDWSDLTISIDCEGGPIQIQALRSVLLCHSPFFKALFSNGMLETSQNTLSFNWNDLPLSAETFFAIFRFFYSGQIKLSNLDVAAQCCAFAISHEITALREKCDQWIFNFDKWDVDTVQTVYEHSNIHRNSAWKQAALSAGIYHILNFPQTSPLRKFMQEHAEEVEEWQYKLGKIPIYAELPCLATIFGPNFPQEKHQQFLNEEKKKKQKVSAKAIPKNIGQAVTSFVCTNFPNIKKLTFHETQTNEILPFITLEKLEELHIKISNIGLEGNMTPLKPLLSFKKLRVLKLEISSIKKAANFVKFLGSLGKQIETLHLSFEFEKNALKNLNAFSNLKNLSVNNHRKDWSISEFPISHLQLEKLCMNFHVQNSLFTFPSTIKELTIPYSEEIFEKLASLKQIETLTLTSVNLTVTSSKYLLHLPQLRNLRLHFPLNSKINENIFEVIAQIPLLEELVLDTGSVDSLHAIKKWITKLEQLRKLDQISCLNFNIQGGNYQEAIEVVAKLKNIRDLSIICRNEENEHLASENFLKYSKLEKISTSFGTFIEPLSELLKLPFLNSISAQNIILRNNWLSILPQKNEDLCSDHIDSLILKQNGLNYPAMVEKMCSRLENVTRIVFDGTLSDLILILSNIKNLKKLTLTKQFSELNRNFMIDGKFIHAVSQHDLELFEIYCNNNLNPEDYNKLSWLGNFKNLLNLIIVHNGLQNKHLPLHEDRPTANFSIQKINPIT